MATVEKISIALPPEMTASLRTAVKSGEYASASEVVREALRDWKRKKKLEDLEVEELRRWVREGEESGPGLPAQEVFTRLEKKYRAMAETAAKKHDAA